MDDFHGNEVSTTALRSYASRCFFISLGSKVGVALLENPISDVTLVLASDKAPSDFIFRSLPMPFGLGGDTGPGV